MQFANVLNLVHLFCTFVPIMVQERVDLMLCYDKLFTLLKEKNIKKSELRNLGFSPTIPGRLARGEHINTINIDKFCKLLNCQPGDLMEYVPDSNSDPNTVNQG